MSKYLRIIRFLRDKFWQLFCIYLTALIIQKEWATPQQVMLFALVMTAMFLSIWIVVERKERKRLKNVTFPEILEEQENQP